MNRNQVPAGAVRTIPRVVMVLYPGIRMIHFAAPQAVFSMMPDGQALFELMMVSPDGRSVRGESSVEIPVQGGLEMLASADIVVVPGWGSLEELPSDGLIGALRAAKRRGALMVGLCYGTYALAHAGLLDGRTAATHWIAADDFIRRFPAVRLNVDALYVEEDDVITSAGTAAALDCCLAIVRKLHGVRVANRIARVLVVAPHREGGQAQFIEQPVARRVTQTSINQLLDEMRQHLDRPYAIDELASRLAMSRSTLTRHFRKATGMAVHEWLIEARLQRARDLLESTQLSVEQVALQSGFQSVSSMRQHFVSKHHVSPGLWRCRFRMSD